jgi:predicted SAM-dependent methyltransferase
VFCEHVFEHFTQDDGERLARELKRCLRPTGTLRIIVPDAERVMRAYFDEPNCLAERRQAATAGEAINSYFRQRYDHHFLYDWPTMQRMLQRAGFVTVVRTSYKVGQLSKEIVLDAPPYASTLRQCHLNSSIGVGSIRPPSSARSKSCCHWY